MKLLLIAALTNILMHPYWEIRRYTAEDCATYGIDTNLIGEVWWMRAHTTTNAPFFHIQMWEEFGYSVFDWSDNITNGWTDLGVPVDQYSGGWVESQVSNMTVYTWTEPIFKIYMHPDSELTQRLLESDAGYFRCGTQWRYEILDLDMSEFFPPCTNTSGSTTNSGSGEFPPIPGG